MEQPQADEFEYVERCEVYKLGKNNTSVELFLDDMMEWTIKSISLASNNTCSCRHNIVLSYDYDELSGEYRSRVVIGRLIPIYCECIKPDIRVSMNDKIKLELVVKGQTFGDVHIMTSCFMPEGCDITKASPFNTIREIQKQREREEMRARKETEKGNKSQGNSKTSKKNKKSPEDDNFDETMGSNKKQNKRDRDRDNNGALVDESLTLEGFLNAPGEIVKGAEGLMYRDHNLGTGEPLKVGQRARIKCSGRLTNGHFFERAKKGSSYDVRVGGGEFIKGLEKALVGMRVGGTRTVVIPPGLGYGSRGVAGIPGGSTLIFEVRLIAIDAPLEATAIMKKRNAKK